VRHDRPGASSSKAELERIAREPVRALQAPAPRRGLRNLEAREGRPGLVSWTPGRPVGASECGGEGPCRRPAHTVSPTTDTRVSQQRSGAAELSIPGASMKGSTMGSVSANRPTAHRSALPETTTQRRITAALARVAAASEARPRASYPAACSSNPAASRSRMRRRSSGAGTRDVGVRRRCRRPRRDHGRLNRLGVLHGGDDVPEGCDLRCAATLQCVLKVPAQYAPQHVRLRLVDHELDRAEGSGPVFGATRRCGDLQLLPG
jgi:hypothetical protein